MHFKNKFIQNANLTESMATDYLTCGECLREFPLQCITLFVQHKKLDCDDDADVQSQDPELKCNYCPQGFMTAWALLVHAQLTHNLKIFLEKASKSLLSQVKLSSSGKGSKSDYSSKYVSVIEDKVDEVPLRLDESLRPTLEQEKSADQSNLISVSQSKVVTNTPQSKMGSNILVTRNILSDSRKNGDGTEIKSSQSSSQNITNDVVPVIPDPQTNSGQTLNIFPLNQASVSLLPKLNILPVSVSSGQVKTGSFKVIPTMLAKTFSETLPESTALQATTSTFMTVLKKETPQGNSIASIDNPNSDNLIKPSGSTTIFLPSLPTPVTISPQSSSRISHLMTNNSVDLSKMSNSVKGANMVKPMTCSSVVNSTGESDSATMLEDSNNLSQPVEGNSNSQDSFIEGEEVETTSSECCNSQGCGVTVMPGSHEDLQECCNAVLPKKRKRHIEQKHMPFSWSFSRYARRKMLLRSLSSSTSRASTSQYIPKSTAGTIFIDLEPDTLTSGDTQGDGTAFKVTQSATPGVRIKGSSNKSVQSDVGSVTQCKPHSLILKPGAVYSIPFTYTIPTSKSVSTTSLSVSKGVFSLADSVQQTASTFTSVKTTEGDQPCISTKDILANVEKLSEAQTVQIACSRRQTSSKPFQCDKCTMAFNQRIHLKKHMSKHTGIKPYKCGECNYSTVERSHLKVHIRIHTGEKPFKCTYCEYATAQNSTLKIHLKRHHGGKMFQCQSCEKQFTQEEQLKGHEWEHGTITTTSSEPQVSTQTTSQVTTSLTEAQTSNCQASPQDCSTNSLSEEVTPSQEDNQHQEYDHMDALP